MDKTKVINIKDKLLNYSLYFILIGILIITIVIEPKFVSWRNISNILQMASTRAIIAMGIAGLIVINCTDLSAGRVVGCCCAVSAALLQSQTYASKMFPGLGEIPLVIGWLGSVIVAVLFSVFIGFCVATLHMSAFIASLGIQLAAYGILCFFMDANGNSGQPISSLDPRYDSFVKGSLKVAGIKIPYLIFYMIIAGIIMYIVWNKTVLGKNIFAIGGNVEAAKVSGINIRRFIMLTFVLSGICIGTGAFLECSRIGTVTATTGQNYEFDAISACAIGGVSFSGGVGTIPGVIMGVIILQTINYCLYFLGVSSYYQYIARGLIIIIAVAIDVRKYIQKK